VAEKTPAPLLTDDDRAHVTALLARIVAETRATGRNPSRVQVFIGAEFATAVKQQAALGVPWAQRVWRAFDAWESLGVEAMLRELGVRVR